MFWKDISDIFTFENTSSIWLLPTIKPKTNNVRGALFSTGHEPLRAAVVSDFLLPPPLDSRPVLASHCAPRTRAASLRLSCFFPSPCSSSTLVYQGLATCVSRHNKGVKNTPSCPRRPVKLRELTLRPTSRPTLCLSRLPPSSPLSPPWAGLTHGDVSSKNSAGSQQELVSRFLMRPFLAISDSHVCSAVAVSLEPTHSSLPIPSPTVTDPPVFCCGQRIPATLFLAGGLRIRLALDFGDEKCPRLD